MTPHAQSGLDWLRTVLLGVRQLRTLCWQLEPTLHLASAAAIEPAFVREHRIGGLIWDVDGTLTEFHDQRVAASVAETVAELFRLPDLRHVVVSNCGERRFRELGKLFPGVPILRMYATKGELLYRRLVDDRDSCDPDELKRQLACGMTLVRKPSRQLVKYAIRELGVPEDRVALVGDQYFTDIASANLAGIRSFKVQTLGPRSFPRSLRALQRIEAAFRQITRAARKLRIGKSRDLPRPDLQVALARADNIAGTSRPSDGP